MVCWLWSENTTNHLTLHPRIIVGVKYCFRYNARNRPRHDENGDPIDLAAMPRQHRRRREKKLMSLDEVNERFPITKYKTWVSLRAEQGLSTAGGVNVSSSRPASIKDHDLTSEEREQSSSELHRPSTATQAKPNDEEKPENETTNATQTQEPSHTEPPQSAVPTEDIDEDDPIHAAVPTEMLANPGDSCAICIDTLEDDDDVRGLTCGHAFHASCVDPWLTSRRACCPLCKADYYIPKPRPEGEQTQETDRPVGRRSTNGRIDMQAAPGLTILTGRRDGRSRSNRHVARNGRQNSPQASPAGASRFFRVPRFQRRQSQPQSPQNLPSPLSPAPEVSNEGRQHWTSRMRPSMPRPQLAFWRRNQTQTDTGTDANPTPGQLEAGSR